jgi:iron complex outermembrane receptor protein
VTLFATAAYAQSAPPQASSTIEELVVTAEKREQSLQDVPVAISAFSSTRRDLIGINSVQDMTNFTPGLTYNNSGDRMTLRGVGRLSNAQAADGPVAIYSDGFFSSSTSEASKQPLFVDRNEVLRGPQGTLYGRNAIGGAVNIISKKPTQDYTAEVRAIAGNYDYTSLQATVSGPITDGLRFRINASRDNQGEGYFQNTVPGQPSEGNRINQTYFEVQLAADFGEHADGWVKFSNFNWNNGGGGIGGRATYTPFPYSSGLQEGTGINSLLPNANFGCNAAATNVINRSTFGCVNPASTDPRKFASNTAQTVSLDDAYELVAQYNYHFDGFDIRYIGGAENYHYTLITDNDGSPVDQFGIATSATTSRIISPLQIATYQENKHWYSHEINIASTTKSAFQWLAGLYYYREGYQQPYSVAAPNTPQLATPLLPNLKAAALNPNQYILDTRNKLHDESYAAFGQIDWNFTDTLKLTAGLRYSHDHKYGEESGRTLCYATYTCGIAPEMGGQPIALDITSVPTGIGTKGVSTNPTLDPATGLYTRGLDASWAATTGTLGLDWKPTADTLAYAKYSRGYKAGALNSGAGTTLAANPYSKAEHNNAYEVGLKQTFGRTFQINIEGFYYDYRNYQAPVSIVPTDGVAAVTQTVFYNVPKAISKGVEVEAQWSPITDLSFLLSYGYDDAYIKEASGVVDPADPAGLDRNARPVSVGPTDIYSGRPTVGQNLAGNQLPETPKNKVALNGLYTWHFEPGSLTASASYIWRDKQYGTIFTRDYYKAPSWNQVDMRLTWKDANDRYSVILYGKNIFNHLGYYEGSSASRIAGITAAGVPTVLGIASTYSLTPPRTYGVELQYRF